MGGKKIKLKFIFPAEKLRALAGLADLNAAKFSEKKIWRALQDEIRDYFAQHPEVSL